MANTVNITNTFLSKGGLTVQGSGTNSTSSNNAFAQNISLNTSTWKAVNSGSLLAGNAYVFIKNQGTGSTVQIAIDASGTNKVCKLEYNDSVILKPVTYAGVPYYASCSIATGSIQVISVD